MNVGRETLTLEVSNSGDRPIQVGSHYHFFETNPALKFDRVKTKGYRLDIAGRDRRPLRARPEPIRAPRRHRGQARSLRLPPGGDGQGVIACELQRHYVRRSITLQ